jgi:hypothetical protein
MKAVARLALLLLPVAAAWAGDPVALVDFERGEPADGWRIQRLKLVETTVEEGAPLAGRRALRLVGREQDDGPVGMIRRPAAVRDWRGFEAFACHVKVEARQPVALRILAIRGEGPAALLRRFTLEPGPWRKVVLPLKDWREHTADQVCDFSRIDQWAILWNRGGGAITVASFELVPGTRGDRSCLPLAADLLAEGFPEGDGKAFKSEHFLLLTDAVATEADAHRILDTFEAGLEHLRDAYRLGGEPGPRVPFYLFAEDEDLHDFVGRLGRHYAVDIRIGAEATAAATMGRAICSVDEGGPAEYARWAIKGAIYRLLGLSNQPNWIQGGLARAVHVHLAEGGEDAADRGLGFLAEGGRLVAWDEFFARRGAQDSRQSHSILQYLAAEHADRLPQVWAAVRGLEGRVHQASPGAIARALGVEREDLEKAWRRWADKS